MRLPAALRFVLERQRWTPEQIQDSAPTEIRRPGRVQEQSMPVRFFLLLRAEISSALSSFLLVVTCARNQHRERSMRPENRAKRKDCQTDGESSRTMSALGDSV